MQECGGFVKIYRKMIDWEWYDDVNTKVVFLHILLNANWKETKWHGETIGEGEYKTTLPTLCSELKLSERNVRTALEHLKKTGTVTVRTNSRYRIITVKNWNEYQQDDRQVTDKRQSADSQTTDDRQADDRQPTDSVSLYREEGKEDKEVKNDKKEKKEKNGAAPSSPSEAEIKDYVDKMGYTFSAENFFDYYERQNWTSRGQPIKDWRKLADNWQKNERPKSPPADRSTFDVDELWKFGILY